MENASKALLIAGGVLIAILLISLLIYTSTVISEYQDSKKELADIEDTAKFNDQFLQYNRDDVEGYELLSLIHKVIDYNERKTTDSTIDTDSYKPIKLEIDFINDENVKKLVYSEKPQLFTNTSYVIDASNRNSSNSFEYKVQEAMNDLPRSRNRH